MIFSFLFELARFAVDLWLWKRECARKPDKPPRYFSWINLCERIISGFGIPILTAYIVFPHSFEASVLAILSIFVLKPQAAPIIAIPAKKMIGTGYGAQLLFVDSLIALSGIFIVLFAGFNVVPNFNFTGPEAQKLMSLGLYITVLPMLVIYGIYNISQVFFVFFMALGLLIYWCTRYSRILKWALSVLLFWWGLIIVREKS
ncbi:hypothetical protein P154DRAFT_524563 [Amniculicola lignicola CBS 123094]|uniref:Uncharacterized protein n=1 Tax=Amniculicola lignicola CBS 123094 TaxID=1392246 RepID=A0A6A5WA61_9PLEO|nr:hypothetical protein P154DRAFT_524563 [Amniculicola lignicola CBS 123094]